MNFMKKMCAYTAVLSAFLVLNGCKHRINIDESQLSGYHQFSNPLSDAAPSTEVNCYLDYSDGMKNKIAGDQDFYQKLTNALLPLGDKVHFFKVGLPDVPEAIPSNSQSTDFRVAGQYTEELSKLQGALDAIVRQPNHTAVFVTDFEQITNAVLNPAAPGKLNLRDNRNWGAAAFTKWLQAGNQIDIFATSCRLKGGLANGQENWVYALVFTPAAILKNETAYKNSILKYLIDNAGDRKHFTYSVANFLIEQKKSADETGDANDNIVVQENITKTRNRGFEYYAFKSGNLVKFNTSESQKGDRRIINKILITSQNPALTDVEYGLHVTDVTDDLNAYLKSGNQAPPQIDTNQENGKKDTVANKPVNYTPKAGTPVEDVFDAVTYNQDTKAVGIKLKPDFTGVSASTVYKVDIVLKSAKLKDFSQEDKVLRLYYTGNYSMDPLQQSIKDAMNKVITSTEGKVIYTIYIQIEK